VKIGGVVLDDDVEVVVDHDAFVGDGGHNFIVREPRGKSREAVRKKDRGHVIRRHPSGRSLLCLGASLLARHVARWPCSSLDSSPPGKNSPGVTPAYFS